MWLIVSEAQANKLSGSLVFGPVIRCDITVDSTWWEKSSSPHGACKASKDGGDAEVAVSPG